jgi:hypothetical protein
MNPRQTCLAFAIAIAGTNTRAYDATAEFSLAGNTNSVWSYGYSLNSGNQYAFVPFDTPTDTGTAQSWTLSNYSVLGTPAAWKNTDPNTEAHGVAPGQLSLHAGPTAASTAILRFTAPAASSYSYSLQFFAGDIGDTQGSAFLNGDGSTPLFSVASTNSSPSQSGVLSMSIGDTFDVAVDKVGNFYQGNTPVTLSISAVPEPATAAMWLLGLSLVSVCRWRLAAKDCQSGCIHHQGVTK